MGTLESTIDYEVKKHLYIKKFMEFVNKRAHRITFLGLRHLSDKTIDLREEYAEFLKRSKLDGSDQEFNDDVIDWIKNASKDQKFQMTYDKLYEAGRKCYSESTDRMFLHLERRPYTFKPIYDKYFTVKAKDMGMEL